MSIVVICVNCAFPFELSLTFCLKLIQSNFPLRVRLFSQDGITEEIAE